MRSISTQLIDAARALRSSLEPLRFGPPVAHVYHPLVYAWAAHQRYLETYARTTKRILFLGMNPGPFGMAQTGVPFGEVAAVRDWLRIQEPVSRPEREHGKRPVLGFDCPRSEVSGRRLWGLFAQRFGTADRFFAEHFVANYCPLLFIGESGCNLTPDRLRAAELALVLEACNRHLAELARAVKPEWVIGIGRFAEQRAREVLSGQPVQVGTILHPSPASPASNRDWEGTASRQLEELGVWNKA